MARVARPTFSIASGIFDTKQNSIQVFCATAGAQIRYKLITNASTDLSPPTNTVGNLIANGGFIPGLENVVAILAIAYKSGSENSYVSSLVRINGTNCFLVTATTSSPVSQWMGLVGPLDQDTWVADSAYTEPQGVNAPILAARDGQALIMGNALFWYVAPTVNRRRTDGSELVLSPLNPGASNPAWFMDSSIYTIKNGIEIYKNQNAPIADYCSLVGIAPFSVKVGGHDGSRIVVGGDNGQYAAIAYSDDGGATFTTVALNVPGHVKVMAINKTTKKFMIATNNGYCFTSLDGATWSPVQSIANNMDQLFHVSGSIWIARAGGNIYRTSSDGSSWSNVIVISTTLYTIYGLAVATLDSSSICVLLYGGVNNYFNISVKESTDGGNSWDNKYISNDSNILYRQVKSVVNQWPESTVLADPIIEIDAGDPSKVRIYPSDVFALTHYTLDETEPSSTIGDAVLWGQEITVPGGAYLKVISTRSGYTSSAVVEYDRTASAVTTKICGYVQPAGSSSHVLLINKTTRQVIEEVVPNPTTGYYEFLNYSADNIQNYSVIPLSGEVGLKVITGMDNVTPEIIE